MTALFGLSTARSLDGEGSIYKHLDYPIYGNTKIEKKDVSIPKSIEVAVIGSGSGGGVAANILNEKYEVGLFEKGSYGNGMTNNETFGYHNFYDTNGIQQTRGYKVLLLAGMGIGGGTSVNWTTSLRTPEKILNEWDSLTGQDNYFNSGEFKRSMDYVCEKLNVDVKNNQIPLKEEKLAEGFDLNNIGYKIIPRNTSNADCTESGFSTFGRYDESINSTNKVWFSEDKFDPDNVFSDTNIKSLDISNGKATHINVENNNILYKVAVDKVILAAGSLNTPKIMLDSGYRNKHLGRNLKLHPVSGVAGKFIEEQKPWLRKVLQDNPNRWTILTFHHPLYSPASSRDNVAIREQWKPILDEFRVDLVLSGHDHSYSRTGFVDTKSIKNVPAGYKQAYDPKIGTVHVVSVSGPKLYEITKGKFAKKLGENTQLYQIIDIEKNNLRFRAFTATGELFDEFLLQKQSNKPNKLIEK